MPDRVGCQSPSLAVNLLLWRSVRTEIRAGHFEKRHIDAQNRAGVHKIGPEGDKIKKSAHKKFHSEAETALCASKTAARAVNSMKTMLQAAKSGYFHFGSFGNAVL